MGELADLHGFADGKAWVQNWEQVWQVGRGGGD